jgi:hypothetical protein
MSRQAGANLKRLLIAGMLIATTLGGIAPAAADSEYMDYSKAIDACNKIAKDAGYPQKHSGHNAHDNQFWVITYLCLREKGYTCAKIADMATRATNEQSEVPACIYFARYHDFTNYLDANCHHDPNAAAKYGPGAEIQCD